MTVGDLSLGTAPWFPFAFIGSGETLPAGEYQFKPDIAMKTMQIASTDKSARTVIAQVITRIGAAIHTSPQDAHLVFDEVGGVRTLSEIWIPGMDGWLLSVGKGAHQHRTVDVPFSR